MTQHEYVFVAISIILGLAITRLLHNIAQLIRAHERVVFHWSTVLWGGCVLVYALQLWWVGWGLREFEDWTFANFAVLTAGSICVYGAAEMAMPVPEHGTELNFLTHSRGIGRLSALSMLLYFGVGPYVNIAMFKHDLLASMAVPVLGAVIMALAIGLPRFFPAVSMLFAIYTGAILAVTT